MVSSHPKHEGQLSGTECDNVHSSTVRLTFFFFFFLLPSKNHPASFSCLAVVLCLSNSLFSSFLRLSLFPLPSFVAQELPLWEVLLPDRRETLFMAICAQILLKLILNIFFFFPSVRQMSLTPSMHCLNTNAFPELDRKKLKYTSATVNEKWDGFFFGEISFLRCWR